MRFLLLFSVIMTLLSCASGPTETPADLVALDKEWAAAVVANDFAKLEEIISPDLVYSHSDGQVDTAEIYMNRMKKKTSDYQGIDIVKIDAKLFGSDVAVVNARAFFRVNVEGNMVNNDLSYTHVYKKVDGKWRMISHQSAKMPAAS